MCVEMDWWVDNGGGTHVMIGVYVGRKERASRTCNLGMIFRAMEALRELSLFGRLSSMVRAL